MLNPEFDRATEGIGLWLFCFTARLENRLIATFGNGLNSRIQQS